MQWIQVSDIGKLSPQDLYQMLKLRQDIFIIEQKCIYSDIDNIDPQCGHLLLKDGERLIGCSRIVPPNIKFTDPSIGRIAVHKNYRNRGFGKEIVQKALHILSTTNSDTVLIEAQKHLKNFYESLGFSKIGDPYLVDGILHIKMKYAF